MDFLRKLMNEPRGREKVVFLRDWRKAALSANRDKIMKCSRNLKFHLSIRIKFPEISTARCIARTKWGHYFPWLCTAWSWIISRCQVSVISCSQCCITMLQSVTETPERRHSGHWESAGRDKQIKKRQAHK